METPENASVPPEQEKGISKDLHERLSCETATAAAELFLDAKDLLLNINEWHEVATGISSRFRLVDGQGQPLHRKAHRGDYIAIELPGPEMGSSEGYDWVRVEAIEYDDYPDQDRELIAIRLRPSANPGHQEEATPAHFFTDASTSTFVIERWHKTIIASYYGRNELPNTDTGSAGGTVRNLVVALGALAGFSDLQWKGLLKGFLGSGGR